MGTSLEFFSISALLSIFVTTCPALFGTGAGKAVFESSQPHYAILYTVKALIEPQYLIKPHYPIEPQGFY